MVETLNAVEAWLGSLARPRLCQRPPAPCFNSQHRSYDPTVRSLGWAGQERSSRCTAPVLCADRRVHAVPFLAPRRRRRTYAGCRSDRCRQIRAARADGAAVPPLSQAQVFAFDFGGSIRAAALAMGGDWHDLGGALSDAPPNRSPCSRSPGSMMPRERGWAAEWIAAMLAREKITMTPEAKGPSLVRAHFTGLGSNRRADPDRSLRAAAVPEP